MNRQWQAMAGKIGATALCLILLWTPPIMAEVCVMDARGQQLCLDQPATRIAALSPGATELVWAAGAGEQVVAVVDYSDYPPAAKAVPKVGSHTRLDMERLLQLQPDLVIAWVTGNPAEQVQMLKDLGLPVFSIEPRSFEAVSDTIERLATLAGTETDGFVEADRFRRGIAELREQYASAEPVPVFYQVWDEPLMTVNNEHLIGEMIQLCGGDN
ncbi:MAG: iron complex transport system substrate-binding protein, partial [Marinobacter sp. T13-3]